MSAGWERHSYSTIKDFTAAARRFGISRERIEHELAHYREARRLGYKAEFEIKEFIMERQIFFVGSIYRNNCGVELINDVTN